MGGGQKIIGLWRNHPDSHEPVKIDVSIGAAKQDSDDPTPPTSVGQIDDVEVAETETDTMRSVHLENDYDAEASWEAYEGESITVPLWQRLFAPTLIMLALIWVSFIVWSVSASPTTLSTPNEWGTFIAQSCIPFALLALLYLIVQRNSQSEANRYGLMARRMEQQSADVEAKLVTLNAYLKNSHEELNRQADDVVQFGLQTAEQLQAATRHIREALNDGLAASNQLTENSQRAMIQFDGLVAGLPKVDDVATRLTENLREAGRTAHQHGSAIEAQIAAIGHAAEQSTASIKEQEAQLQDRLDAMASKAENTRQLVEQATVSADTTYSDLGARVAGLFATLHDDTSKFSNEHLSHIENLHGRISANTDQSLELLSARLGDADAAVAALTARIHEQEAYSNSITAQLTDALQQIDTEFATFDANGRDRLDKLAIAVSTLEQHTEGLTSKVQLGSEGANQLIGKSESLLVALDSVTRELEESLPRAFARLDDRLSASRGELTKISPELERVEAVAEATLGRLRESDGLVRNQYQLIDDCDTKGTALMVAQQAALAELELAMTKVNEQAVALSDQSGPRLVEALVRVRETATQASERAREALTAVIPDSANKLGEASAQAMADALGDKVEQKLAEINAATERAVAATNAAATQLMERIDAIGQTSDAIEKRVNDTKASIDESDRDTLTRRVALLTESLNSTAVDVSKILSNDVTDVAWEAYLKGDRSVFARRAVRLIDNSESREILRHYEEDAEFRGHVNRYIYDFESILRNLLGSRDGSSLSVALLSSDMGKLYVALAQAIERLRN